MQLIWHIQQYQKVDKLQIFFSLTRKGESIYCYQIFISFHWFMQIEKNIDLQSYNTLQIAVKAKYFVKIENESDIFELMDTEIWKSEKHCILSG